MKKVVLITGGTSGIGRAICNVLHSKGYIVYGTGRSVKNDERLDGFHLVLMDVNNEDSVHAAIQFVLKQEGRIDVLVNNAGIGMAGAIEDSTVSEIVDVFNTNVAGIIRTCQAVLPPMRKQESGLIINVSSMGAFLGLPYRGIYCASKAAVEIMTEALSQEIMQFGIKTVLIEPGDFNTSINQNRFVSEKALNSVYKEDFDRIYKVINEEVSEGGNPKQIGVLVAKIIEKKKPKLRYNVANFQAKLALTAKRTLRYRWYEKLLMKHYEMKRK